MFSMLYDRHNKIGPNGRVYYFDNLKLFLIFLVILAHLLDPITKTDHAEIARVGWFFIYSFHMPLFIFVAGLFYKDMKKESINSKIFLYFFLYVILKTTMLIIEKCFYADAQLHLFAEGSIPWFFWGMAIWYLVTRLTEKINIKYLLAFSLLLSLAIGYDSNIGDYLMLSRVIVFFPFFLLGARGIVVIDDIIKLVSNKYFKVFSFVILLLIAYIFFTKLDSFYFIRPILTARNSYFTVEGYEAIAVIFRAAWYVWATVISILIMAIIPQGKAIISSWGGRTLTIFFLHTIVIKIYLLCGFELRVYECIILSVVILAVFSYKGFSNVFNKFMRMKPQE